MVKESTSSLSSMFDLIVMDLNMPISDGFEATTNIINFYKTAKLQTGNNLDVCNTLDLLPVIVGLSAHVDREIIVQSKEVGMVVCFEAPLHASEIETQINQMLTLRENRLNRLQMINHKLAKIGNPGNINKSYSISMSNPFSFE